MRENGQSRPPPFNAKTPRRRDAKRAAPIRSFSAPLRLCALALSSDDRIDVTRGLPDDMAICQEQVAATAGSAAFMPQKCPSFLRVRPCHGARLAMPLRAKSPRSFNRRRCAARLLLVRLLVVLLQQVLAEVVGEVAPDGVDVVGVVLRVVVFEEEGRALHAVVMAIPAF